MFTQLLHKWPYNYIEKQKRSEHIDDHLHEGNTDKTKRLRSENMRHYTNKKYFVPCKTYS